VSSFGNQNSCIYFYGRETWTVTWREEHRWRIHEKRVLRRIVGRTKEEVRGGLKNLNSDQVHNLLPKDYIAIKERKKN
jgi:hypothetical protein